MIFLQIRLRDAHAQPSEARRCWLGSLDQHRCMSKLAASEIVALDPHSIDIDANIEANRSISVRQGVLCVSLVLAACSFGFGGIPLGMFDDAPSASPVGCRY